MLLDAVEAQLVHQPAIVTRNRKLLRGNATAAWELRIGVLRVYYDVDEDPEPTVAIQAIGIKKRDRVYVGGRLADL